jgi:plastocyanin
MLLILGGCATLPTMSRTGKSAVVTITEESVEPLDVAVQVGDEVKIVNSRPRPVWIYFSRDDPRELSCQRGFSYFWGPEESAKVESNRSVSLCFAKPGTYSYSIQSSPIVQGGARLGELEIRGAVPAAIIVKDGKEGEQK